MDLRPGELVGKPTAHSLGNLDAIFRDCPSITTLHQAGNGQQTRAGAARAAGQASAPLLYIGGAHVPVAVDPVVVRHPDAVVAGRGVQAMDEQDHGSPDGREGMLGREQRAQRVGNQMHSGSPSALPPAFG